jgi:soluble lytic murein transglycosylase-like protein
LIKALDEYADQLEKQAREKLGDNFVSFNQARRQLSSRHKAAKPPHAKNPDPYYDNLISKLEHDNKLSRNIIRAIMSVETTDYDPNAVSGAGARGVMQLMPGTARSYGVNDPRDQVQSIKGGAAYLKDLYDIYHNKFKPPLSQEDVDKFVLAEYNGGPDALLDAGLRKKAIPGQPGMFGNVKYSDIEPHLLPETKYYVRNVRKAMKEIQAREDIYHYLFKQ